ncbi:hypothetical protein C9I98_10580 [Photobacterium sanctipauli]|uniref:Uncharacterized protein n=1 Tax=Photobacterium sanctipauli TaxID=1342794 RepID=A0A2T3NUJ3_9GAMM|nr:hypothetical protein [Photobacterium sanctipauli]PSW19898.1 hypothetical protein C9I98_10580 [Photobacterium sanctipauli]
MIILITDVVDAEHPSEAIDIVSFDIIEGAPNFDDIARLLNREMNKVLALFYSSNKERGQFITLGRECIKGQHFNDVEH